MKICLDVTPITSQPSGVGFYILSLAKELYQLQSQEDFQVMLAYQPKLINWLCGRYDFPACLEAYTNRKIIPIPVRLSNVLLMRPMNWINSVLTNYLDNPKIIHGTNYSVYPQTDGYRVKTIYDVSFGLYPEYATSVSRAYLAQIRKCLEWTDLVITISESSKRDIVNCFKLSESKVWVTPLASRYSSNSSLPDKPETLKTKLINTSLNRNSSYRDGKPYILFVGTIEPRKNIISIIKAFNQLKFSKLIEHQLLLVGRKGWFYEPIFEEINQSAYRENIYHLDYVSDASMIDLYQNATVFVYPSHYEGFGLPILEAMSLGCPVVSSNTSSIPEVVGNAAFMVSPEDIEELANALYYVIDNSSVQQSLVTAGYKQAATFSWKRTAQATIEAYRSLVL